MNGAKWPPVGERAAGPPSLHLIPRIVLLCVCGRAWAMSYCRSDQRPLIRCPAPPGHGLSIPPSPPVTPPSRPRTADIHAIKASAQVANRSRPKSPGARTVATLSALKRCAWGQSGRAAAASLLPLPRPGFPERGPRARARHPHSCLNRQALNGRHRRFHLF